MVAELESLTSLRPKSTVRQDPESFYGDCVIATGFVKIFASVPFSSSSQPSKRRFSTMFLSQNFLLRSNSPAHRILLNFTVLTR